MENSKNKNLLYGVIALLLLALAIETGLLLSRSPKKSEKKKEMAPVTHPYFRHAPTRSFRQQAPRPALAPTAWGDWDPFEEMQRMQEEMNRVFDEGFGRALRSPVFSSPAGAFSKTFDFSSFSPAIDLQETEEAYIARADLPGLEKDKIQASVSGNLLTIQGERQAAKETEDTQKGFFAQERSFGSFARSITLPGPQVTRSFTNSCPFSYRSRGLNPGYDGGRKLKCGDLSPFSFPSLKKKPGR